jgi:hypothetical protein
MQLDGDGPGAKRQGPMRMVALGIVAAVCFLVLYMLWFLGRPVIWKLWAELTHKPAAAAAKVAAPAARALLRRHLLGA